MSTHTPTPYTVELVYVGDDPLDSTEHVQVCHGATIIADCGPACQKVNRKHAALIVQAVNAHAALVNVLTECDRAFANWQVGQIPGRPEDILALIVQVRAALALAERAP